jgi:hypothetical protein
VQFLAFRISHRGDWLAADHVVRLYSFDCGVSTTSLEFLTMLLLLYSEWTVYEVFAGNQ